MNEEFNNVKKKLGIVRRFIERGIEKTLALAYPSLLVAQYPVKSLVIELTNICNLCCPLCPSPISHREKGVMSFSDFVRITDTLPKSVDCLELYFSGEPFINKDLFNIIKHVHKKGIYSHLSTNGTLIGDNVPDLVSSQLSKLIISLDGATEDTYNKYRVGGNFKKVVHNIRKLVEERDKSSQKNPSIELQYIIMKHTEKEIDMAVKLAKDLKVDALSLVSVSLGTHHISENKRKEIANCYLPEDLSFSRYILDASGMPINKWNWNYCPHWKSGVILWNGDITVCCYDHNAFEVYGNLLKSTFNEIWNSKIHYEVIKKILFRKMEICRTCSISSGDENRYIKF